MSTFVKQSDVAQEQFDWGTIGWRCRPANTGAKQLVVMDVTLERRRGSAVGIFSSVILVGNTTGAVVFGYVAHGLGYAIMWSGLTVLLAVGSFLSTRLRVGYAAPPAPAAAPARG